MPILMPFLSPANEKTRKLPKLLKMTDDLLILFLSIMINGKSFLKKSHSQSIQLVFFEL